MDTQNAYNNWAAQYDTNENKTRDLEAKALREILSNVNFRSCLEIGCGTGKNTEWLLTRAEQITAVDLSEEMLSKANEKIPSQKVDFLIADINSEWNFTNKSFDLASFSLVLEHIEHLDPIFKEVSKKLNQGGYVYIGELHPFKQYTGSKARFETEEGLHIVQCYNHNISDFVQGAGKHGLRLVDLNEYFDDHDRSSIPRILTLLFQKTS